MRIERLWSTTRLRLRSLLRGRRVEDEMNEELLFHLDHRIQEGIASGLTPGEARHAAMRAMGGLEQRKEEIRDARGLRLLTDFATDVRHAIRGLRRTPGLSAFVVLTLALGIGMSAASFSGLDGLVFRPYPVPRPDDVVSLVSTTHDNRYGRFSWREYADIRDETKSYDGVIASTFPAAVGYSPGPAIVPRAAAGMMVSGNYFRVLGVEPTIGRGFRDGEDEVPGRDAVAILGDGFWKSEFAQDPAAVGRTIRLNGAEFTVIGVAPESFPGLQIFLRPDVYVPLAMASLFSANPQKQFFVDRDDRQLSVRARLRRGVTQPEARSEMALLARNFASEFPQTNRERGAEVDTPLQMRTRPDDVNWKFLAIAFGLALAVLLVACTNVAGLLLSRAHARTREIAVRLALGAGRFRLVRMLLTESLVLAVLGGLSGILVGHFALTWMTRLTLPTELPALPPFQIDGRVMTAAMALAVLSAFVCGVAPALQSARTDLLTGLKSGDATPIGRRRLWGRSVLVIAQVATSLMLLAAAFLMDRGFRQSVSEGVAFAKDPVLLARFDPRLIQYDSGRTRRFYDQLTDRARAIPGVVSAALSANPPLTLDPFGAITFVPDGFEMPRNRDSFASLLDTVDEGFFDTVGIPVLRGRGFLASDTEDAPRVAIVNEQLARHYWPDREAVGQHIRLDDAHGARLEIVGVVKTVKYREGSEKPTDCVYLPVRQQPAPRLVLMLRSNGDPLALVAPLKEVVRTLDANMPLLATRSYEDLYRYHAVEGPAAAMAFVGSLGVIGLILAIAGLYGLIAYNVSRRTREIGVRMALGAKPGDVLRLVLRQGLVLVGTGSAIGLGLGLSVERLMNSMLFNVGGVDLTVYAVVVPSMLLATTAAASVPARRAARIAPTEALRCD
ncbi:MAG TPA: ABC transporter permease [Candidatus Polarisedimenticolia bacterium]|jgi:putative ABC transport system permease protein|nr:ABC transporter permease [Candidatus Polarisedimenticolia bacterium]